MNWDRPNAIDIRQETQQTWWAYLSESDVCREAGGHVEAIGFGEGHVGLAMDDDPGSSLLRQKGKVVVLLYVEGQGQPWKGKRQCGYM